jgi:hypothetical protein
VYNPGSELFAGQITAGIWTLGLYDSASPTNAKAQFTVTDVSAIPLPASALFLGSLVGGVAWRSRRKRQVA